MYWWPENTTTYEVPLPPTGPSQSRYGHSAMLSFHLRRRFNQDCEKVPACEQYRIWVVGPAVAACFGLSSSFFFGFLAADQLNFSPQTSAPPTIPISRNMTPRRIIDLRRYPLSLPPPVCA